MNNADLKDRYNEIYKKGYSNHVSYNSLEESEAIAGMIPDWRNLKVLEVGCGEGRLAAMLAIKGADVTAIDYSKEAIETAKKTYSMSNLEYKEDFSGKYDAVVMQGVLEHMDKPFEFLETLFKKNLNKTGCIITSSPGFINPRGVVWMVIQKLFDIKMSLNDLHEINPWDVWEFCGKKYKLEVRTCNTDWSTGEGCIKDFEKRFKSATFKPLVKDATGIDWSDKRIDSFLKWFELALKHMKDEGHFKGGNIIYKITRA